MTTRGDGARDSRVLEAEFQTPPALYRGKPFWAWNGKLEEGELRRQIRLLHRMGFGGFFMHSRVGLDTAYLSPEWFDCVAACIDEAKRLGMEAWLYDEDRWPSGAGGGLVTRDPRFRSRRLMVECLQDSTGARWDASVLAVFTGVLDEQTKVLRNVRRIKTGRLPKLGPDESLLIFRSQLQPCSDWYNGGTYLDTLNPKAVAAFIRMTHEAYRKRFGKLFGGVVPGIFTDEPNFGFWRPWTDRFPQEFKKRFGYDLLDHLPELCYRVDGRIISKVRHNYTDCATHLFVDAFMRQIGAWCEKAGLVHTGHVLAEETMLAQSSWTGSVMRSYEHMQAPGIDLLNEYSRDYDSAKQLASVARQFGRRWRLTETYGCTGWDFSFEAHKAIGDWQAALGINFRCQHLSLYTLEGEAKRDYPASIFYQSPWWESYAKVEAYFARLHVVLSRGQEVRDLLVIHPVESMWALPVTEGNISERRDYDQVLWTFRDALLGAKLDFDYGDEDILARHARIVKRGGMPRFQVGKADYTVVAVPPMLTMRRSTLNLLAQFHRAGGRVVFAGTPAGHVDGVPGADVAAFARLCMGVPESGPRLIAALEPARRVSITGPDGKTIVPALYQLREDRHAWYLFVCNTGHNQYGRDIHDSPVAKRSLVFPDVRIGLRINAAGQPLELDPDTGRMAVADAKAGRGGWELRTSLPRLGSRLFMIPKQADHARALMEGGALSPPSYSQSGADKAAPSRECVIRREPLGGKLWNVVLSEDNPLVLDRPRFKIGDGAWQNADEILRVDGLVRDALGVARRGGEMLQPWARKATPQPRSIPVALDYAFEVAAVPTGSLYLAVERPEFLGIRINGVDVSTDMECGWWVDRSLKKLAIDPALLRKGWNTVTLSCNYTEDAAGLEIIYILGRFGVKTKGTSVTMTAMPTQLRLGNWVPQGLAFYSGSVAYETTVNCRPRAGERLFVEVPAYAGVAVRVLVDGRQAGVIAWEPNEVDITDFVTGAEATLRFEILGSRRNSHGPLHYVKTWPSRVGPREFLSKDKKWSDAYQLVPCGLMKPPRLVVRK